MREPLPTTNESLARALARGEPVALDQPFGFACRGCGHQCCVNTVVLVSPPEAARILWHLDRHPDLASRIEKPWGTLQVGGSSGLPLIQLRFVPFENNLTRCPFLAPVYNTKGTWLQMAWCGIREARPTVCRLYPLGRMSALGDDSRPHDQDYRIIDHCAGFEPAEAGHVPPGYTPPGNQTVREWVAQQVDAEQSAEKDYYLAKVVPAYVQAHLHAPTEDNPEGFLSESEALELGRQLFYNPPATPPDSQDDHQTIMAWLALLVCLVPKLGARFKS